MSCPITQIPYLNLTEPVHCSVDGYTYEGEAIRRWVSAQHNSPMTRQPVRLTDLTPNRAVLDMQSAHQTQADQAPQADHANSTANLVTATRISTAPGWVKLQASGSPPAKTVIFILDTSGSMVTKVESSEVSSASRLDLVRHSVIACVLSLPENYYFSIITFNTQAKLVYPRSRANEHHKQAALSTLRELRPGGETNLWAGLQLGLSQASAVPDNMTKHLVLLTDGEPTIEPPRGTVNTFNSYPVEAHKIVLHTFGYGYQLQLNVLDGLTRRGGGWFAFVPDASLVGSTFVNFIASLTSSAVSQVTVAGQQFGAILTDQDKWLNLGSAEPSDLLADGQPVLFQSIPEPLEPSEIDQLAARTLMAQALRQPDSELLKQLVDRAQQPAFAQYKWALTQNPLDPTATGQLLLAWEPTHYRRWGRIYLTAMSWALNRQYTPNFKDEMLFQFSEKSDLFARERYVAETLILGLEMYIAPSPSTEDQLSRTSYLVPAALAAPATAHGPAVDFSTFYNRAGGCFTPYAPFIRVDGEVVPICRLRPGDIVKTMTGQAKIEAIVRHQNDNDEWYEVCYPDPKTRSWGLTPYHPVYLAGRWEFPIRVTGFPFGRDNHCMYNLMLERGAGPVRLWSPYGGPHIYGATLGHEMTGEVIEHEWYGQAVRRALEPYVPGIVDIEEEFRDPTTYRVTGWRLAPASLTTPN